ncbi:E3 ubiquitin-protein ligase PHF7 isoform X3 [Macrotis lagotis]|uniref:E3 ubiquitin-protein ligase PHF7 isoform X3 n=1 Tax=Macrotis lagotis TaxID=92651 RepID=UPI003D695919
MASMDSYPKTSKRRQAVLLGRPALCARKRELPSSARKKDAGETSIYPVAEREAASHSFLASTICFLCYRSFCEKHRPTQDIQPEKWAEDNCILCCESLSAGNDDNIQSPCCSRMIYHRKCIQKYAHSSAKHFFKCPQCNNREEFPKEMLRMGIHIPDRDAAWELEPGAFSELYQRHQHCDAPICLFKDGRDNFENEGRWSLILCTTCGSQGTHRGCSSLRSNSKIWECAECLSTGEIPGCSKALSPGGHFYKETGQNSSQEENPGPSFLQENSEFSSPEKVEPFCWGRRRSTWRVKCVKTSKSCKKKE